MVTRIAPMVAKFRQSTADDLAANRVYIEQDPSEYTLQLTPIGEVPIPTPDEDGFSRIDLAELVNAAEAEFDGTYDIYITAVDQRGNESSPLELQDVIVDFKAPDAPTEGEIERS